MTDTPAPLRHPAAMPQAEDGREAAVQRHMRALAELAVDADCMRKALPDEHPGKRAISARARIEKAALVLDEARIEQLAKVTSKLLRDQEHEEHERLRVADDIGILKECHGERVVLGDVVRGTRESAANDLLEDLRDRVLSFGKDDVEHVIRANDGHSRPRGWAPDFGPDEFASEFPRMVRRLNAAYTSRTDRTDWTPLVPSLATLTVEQTAALRDTFSSWRDKSEATEVTLDGEIRKLAVRALQDIGADRIAAKNAFSVDYQRQTMGDRRRLDCSRG